MFTGIVTDIGRIRAVEPGGDPRFVVETGYATGEIALGASIAHAGICLTVIDKGPGWYTVQASAETLGLTTAKSWRPGTLLNLERALRVGEELGGHIMSGHVDGIGTIVATAPENDSTRFTIEAPASIARFIAPKGSIAVDGVSLTVNAVEDVPAGARFGVNIIPHTRAHTTFDRLEEGDSVNLEIDMLARYVARLSGRYGQ
ncbi:MAG TPA: riboflavin synthase [Stellaceae bacterium]|nr:riboflavin synthase [Stellaceae bacterium]